MRIEDLAREHGDGVEAPRHTLLTLVVSDAERRVTERLPLGELYAAMKDLTLGGVGSGAVVELSTEPRPVLLARLERGSNHQLLVALQEGFHRPRGDGLGEVGAPMSERWRIDRSPFGYRGTSLQLEQSSLEASDVAPDTPEPARTLMRRTGPVIGLDPAWLPALRRIDELGPDGATRYELQRLFEDTRPLAPSPKDLAALARPRLARELVEALDGALLRGSPAADRPFHQRVAIATDPVAFVRTFVDAWRAASPEDPSAFAGLAQLDALLCGRHERTDCDVDRVLAPVMSRHVDDERWGRMKEALGLPAGRPPPSILYARALLSTGEPLGGYLSDVRRVLLHALIYPALRGAWPTLLPGGDLLMLATAQADFAPCRDHAAPAWLSRFSAAAELFPAPIAAADSGLCPAPRVESATPMRPGETQVAALLSGVRAMRFDRVPVDARGRASSRGFDGGPRPVIVGSPAELMKALEDAWSGFDKRSIYELVRMNRELEDLLRFGPSPEDEARIQEALEPVAGSPRYTRFVAALGAWAPREVPLATVVRAAVMAARRNTEGVVAHTLLELWADGLWPVLVPHGGLVIVDAQGTYPSPAPPPPIRLPAMAANLVAIAPLLLVPA